MAGFAKGMHIDPRIGRRTWRELQTRAVRNLAVDYLTVDTLRVPREVMTGIFESWRGGYAATVAELANLTPDEARARFDDIVSCIRDPLGYAARQVPLVTGLKPQV